MTLPFKGEGWRNPSLLFFLSILLFFSGCATTAPQTFFISGEAIEDISEGLPVKGLWRQNIALADMNGDSILDIIAPPTRKPDAGEELTPHIFLRDGSKWKKGEYRFPNLSYGYGGIAADDLSGDFNADIALAVHSGRILLLMRDKEGFSEVAFPTPDEFRSRTIEIADINGDGWKDIIALSEFPPSQKEKPLGIIIGLNKGGKGWDIRVLEDSREQFGDYMGVGDINGDGNNDIVTAPQVPRYFMKPVWIGDGKGGFKEYTGDLLTGDNEIYLARCGDIDGDGKTSEVVFKIAGRGVGAKSSILVLRWNGEAFEDITKELKIGDTEIIVFDLEDVDRDGKKEIVLLSHKGIQIYGYSEKGWIEEGYYALSRPETLGVYGMRVQRDGDGSSLIVFNQGSEKHDMNGIRAFKVR